MKSGFVAIIGRPNVGKSTLLNKILNFKLSITSSTPQTTRDQIKGIYNDEDSQIVFIDTPGIHKPKQKLGDSLNEASFKSLKDADIVLFLQPLDEKIGPGDKLIIERLEKSKNKVAIMTKIDQGDVEIAKERAQELKALGFNDVLGTSVNMNESIKHLMRYLKDNLPEGEAFYDREDLTDLPLWFVAKEIIRESAIENTTEEVPHSIGVGIDDFKDPIHEKDSCDIRATIFVERDSQKGILIGKNGAMIKKIGIASREKLEGILHTKVNLNLRIKVNKNWTDNDVQIKRMGY